MAASHYACTILLGLTLVARLENSCTSATEEDTSDSTSLPKEDQESESNETGTKKAASPYYNPPFDPANPSEPMYSKSGQRIFTQNELAAHKSGGPLKPMMLAIMGRVYDVDKGRPYSPGGGYDFFTGLDGSRAFVSGDFSDEGLTDDLSGLTPLEVKEIDDWVKFYNKDYTYAGKLIGRYYDRDGNPTKAWYKYRKALEEAAAIKEDQDADKKRFPPCNSRYTPQEGGTVFCSSRRLENCFRVSSYHWLYCLNLAMNGDQV